MVAAAKTEKALQVTPTGRLSFPALFSPKQNDNGDDKYEATLIFTEKDDLSAIETAIQAAATKKWGDKAPAFLKKVKYPIKSNEVATDKEGNRRGGYEEDAGRHCKFWSTSKPRVVGREKDPATGKWLELTKDEIFAGCYVRVSFTAFAGEHATGGPYVSFIMQNVQLVREGEPLAGIHTTPEDDFADDPDVRAALDDNIPF